MRLLNDITIRIKALSSVSTLSTTVKDAAKIKDQLDNFDSLDDPIYSDFKPPEEGTIDIGGYISKVNDDLVN